MSGGILLESGSPLLGDAIGYALDSSDLAPTLSRNAVRRDQAFEALVRAAQAQVVHLVTAVVDQLERRVGRLRQHAIAVERELDPDDRAAVEWLRARVMEPEVQPDPRLRRAPVFETADGDLVSVEDLERTRGGRLPVSRVPRTREELFGYVDRGVPVLLLYRDVEDFLDRLDLETVEVDGLDLGREVETSRYSVGEAALVRRRPLRPVKRRRTWVLASGFSVAAAVGIALAIAWPTAPAELPAAGPTPGAGPWQQAHVVPPGPRDFWLPRFVALGVAVMSLGMAVGLAYHFLTRTGRPSLAVDPARPRVKKRKRRVRVWTQAILHPIDFMVARLWSQSGRAEPAPAVEGYRELAPEHMVRNGVRLDLEAVPLGFVDLRGARGAEHEGRVLVVRERRVLLNRNHPTIRDLTRLAEVDPLRSRILLECLLGTDPDLARETDPRQVEWDLLSRAQAWVATGRRAHGADGDG